MLTTSARAPGETAITFLNGAVWSHNGHVGVRGCAGGPGLWLPSGTEVVCEGQLTACCGCRRWPQSGAVYGLWWMMLKGFQVVTCATGPRYKLSGEMLHEGMSIRPINTVAKGNLCVQSWVYVESHLLGLICQNKQLNKHVKSLLKIESL